MANFEAIRFPSPTQSLARSPKLRFYESLFEWNQGVDRLVATLRGMEKFPFARKKPLQHAQSEIEELRADVNADVMEELTDRELDDAGRFWQQRRAYEKAREDPDDVYIDVQRREEERKKQGLPPRVGIVLYSAVADEKESIEEEQERKKQRRSKRPKAAANAQRAVRGKNHD